MREKRGTTFREEHVGQAYEFIKAQNPDVLKNIRKFNGFLSHRERQSIFESQLRDNFELGKIFNGPSELWWKIDDAKRIKPVPDDDPVALLFELLVYQHLSPEWLGQ